MTEEIKNQMDEPDKFKKAAFLTLVSIIHEKELEIKKCMNLCQTLEMQLKEQQNVKRNNREEVSNSRPSNRRDRFIFPNPKNPPVISQNRTYHHSKSLEVKGPTSRSSLRNSGDTLATDNDASVGASVSLDPACMPAIGGVSSQIFNNVVNELVKTKLRLQDLQKEKGVDNKNYIISKQTEAELRYLRNEHQRLRQENEDFKLKVEANKVLINQMTALQSSLSPKPLSPFKSPRAVGISVQQVSTQTDPEQTKPGNVSSQSAQTEKISIRNQTAQTDKISSMDDTEDLHTSVGQRIEELKQELDKVRQEKETFERNYEQLMGSIDDMERNYEDKISSLQQTNQFLVSDRQHLKEEYSKLNENARILRDKLREEVQKNQHLQDALQQLDSGSDFDNFSQRLPFQSLYGRDSLSTQSSQHSRESPHHFAERNPMFTPPFTNKSPSQQALQRNEHPTQTVLQSGHASNHPPSERDADIHQTVPQVSTIRQMGNMSHPLAQVTNREGYLAQPLPQGVTPPGRGYYRSQPLPEVSAPSPGRGGYIPQPVSQAGYAPSPQYEKHFQHQSQVVSSGDVRTSDSGRDISKAAFSAFSVSPQAGAVREPPVGDDISPETVYHTQHVCERCFGDFKTYDMLLHHYQKCLD
ncbi:hypothetical protein ACJMK2_034433 [Sinanodonta woodiana]|uniref:Uncharacterized protein n=1 Tax=Sinanodonta woodiana TaxID=1069815 RepID=A0ABD3WS39_SINWO